MFLLKKIISQFLNPTTVCFEVMIAGLILLFFTRRQRSGKIVIAIGIGVFAFLSHSGVSRMLLRPLEHRYPPLFLSATPNTTNDAAASTTDIFYVRFSTTEGKITPLFIQAYHKKCIKPFLATL